MNQDQDPLNILNQLLKQLFQGDVRFEFREEVISSSEGDSFYFDAQKDLDFDTKKHLLYQLVSLYEKMLNQDILLEKEFGINLNNFTENFYKIIDALILICFDRNIAQLLYFYFYERQNPDGSLNVLELDDEEILIENVKDLFRVILKLNPNLWRNG